jgi:hypothetical protein
MNPPAQIGRHRHVRRRSHEIGGQFGDTREIHQYAAHSGLSRKRALVAESQTGWNFGKFSSRRTCSLIVVPALGFHRCAYIARLFAVRRKTRELFAGRDGELLLKMRNLRRLQQPCVIGRIARDGQALSFDRVRENYYWPVLYCESPVVCLKYALKVMATKIREQLLAYRRWIRREQFSKRWIM